MAQRDVFPIRLSAIERATVDALADKLGCSSGEAIRGLIHQARGELSTPELIVAMQERKVAA